MFHFFDGLEKLPIGGVCHVWFKVTLEKIRKPGFFLILPWSGAFLVSPWQGGVTLSIGETLKPLRAGV
jgi:hypothetical protein